jgi:hypothetical protein
MVAVTTVHCDQAIQQEGAPRPPIVFGTVAVPPSYLSGGPFRRIIAQEPPDIARRGIAHLAPTCAPPWLGIKTLWFSVPAYQGPFVIRAKRLDHVGQSAWAGCR